MADWSFMVAVVGFVMELASFTSEDVSFMLAVVSFIMEVPSFILARCGVIL